MIKAIIAAISFYLLPILVGRAFILLFGSKKKESAFSLVNYFTAGGLILFLLTFVIYFFPFLPSQSAPVYLRVILSLIFALVGFFNLLKLNAFRFSFKKDLLVIFWILALGGVIYGLWRWDIAYPLPVSWDFFHHQTLVNQIKAGRLSFLPSQITDTFRFNGYSPLFHLLLAWPQFIFNPDVLTYFWWLEFLHLLTTLGAAYFLAKKLLKTRMAAVIATLFSGLIFESYMIYTSLFLIPQTLAAVIFAFLIAQTLTSPKLSFKKVWLNYLFLFLIHNIIGAVAIVILLFAWWLSSKKHWLTSRKIFSLIVLIGLGVIFLLSRITLPINLEFLNRGEAAHFNYSFEEKIEFLRTFTGYALFSFSALAILRIIINQKTPLKILLLTTLPLFALVVLPLPYTLRFYVLAHFPVTILTTFGFLLLFSQIKAKGWQILTLLILGLTMPILFISSSEYVKSVLRNSGSNAIVAWPEIQAAKFLQDHYGQKNAFLVSDPATQQILEPLSDINTQGGGYSDLKTREILHEISQLNNPDQIKAKLGQIQDRVDKRKPDILLFALSGRYFRWQEVSLEQKQDLSFCIWAPADLSLKDLETTRFLAEDDVFQEVFRNESLIIFQTTPALDNPIVL